MVHFGCVMITVTSQPHSHWHTFLSFLHLTKHIELDYRTLSRLTPIISPCRLYRYFYAPAGVILSQEEPLS